MVELVVLEQAVARQRMKRAEKSPHQAKAIVGESCGLAVSLALCARMRSRQRLVARGRLPAVPPTSASSRDVV
ncbi:MAG: hypothetical protein EOS65_03030 [Mesorhizobium sp.]|nr:hypothetical protein EN779_01620 [Mesorhizobium sp. M4B.F.Ca.ET.088.02.2.1]RWF27461.1 MAG: hypothetical protein EOS45_25855 [Mesorhizobium sp.]RWF44117.1 MAG: hypothetical protein EOS65_03030 [Mesorhizobium sp.]